VSHFKKYGVYS